MEKHKESGSNEQSNANNLDNVTEKIKDLLRVRKMC